MSDSIGIGHIPLEVPSALVMDIGGGIVSTHAARLQKEKKEAEMRSRQEDAKQTEILNSTCQQLLIAATERGAEWQALMAQEGRQEYYWSELAGLDTLPMHISKFPPKQLWQLRCFTVKHLRLDCSATSVWASKRCSLCSLRCLHGPNNERNWRVFWWAVLISVLLSIVCMPGLVYAFKSIV